MYMSNVRFVSCCIDLDNYRKQKGNSNIFEYVIFHNLPISQLFAGASEIYRCVEVFSSDLLTLIKFPHFCILVWSLMNATIICGSNLRDGRSIRQIILKIKRNPTRQLCIKVYKLYIICVYFNHISLSKKMFVCRESQFL